MDLKARAESRVIDGVTYRCWPLPFATGRPLLVRAFKAIAPAFGALVGGEADAKAAIAALEAVARSLTDEDLATFGAQFGNAAEYDDAGTGKAVPLIAANQNLHFAGRYDAFLEWLMFSMEVNGFARFFNSLRQDAPTPAPPASGSSA